MLKASGLIATDNIYSYLTCNVSPNFPEFLLVGEGHLNSCFKIAFLILARLNI